MEIHLVLHQNKNAIRIYAFSTERLARDFIALNKKKFKERHGYTRTWGWSYRKVELDKEVI